MKTPLNHAAGAGGSAAAQQPQRSAPQSSKLKAEDETVFVMRGGLLLPLIDVAARANLVDEERPVLQIGEEHPPIADSQAVLLILSAFEAPHITPALLNEKVDCAGDLLPRRPVEAGELLTGSFGPFNSAAHPVSPSSCLISSWDVVSPLARSACPSRTAAKSSSVSGSSSAGAAWRARRRGSGVCPRYSRYRRAAGISGSGNSSTNVWSVCRSSMIQVYTSRRRSCYHGAAHLRRHREMALNPAGAPDGFVAREQHHR